MEPASHSIHCVAGVLKEYFRELPVPIVPFERYQNFVDASQNMKGGDESEESQFDPEVLQNLISLLPEVNRKVKKILFQTNFKSPPTLSLKVLSTVLETFSNSPFLFL